MKKELQKIALTAILVVTSGVFPLCGVQAQQLSGEPMQTTLSPSQGSSITSDMTGYVADAAMYRGTVVSVFQTDSVVYFTLRQEEGTNFGIPELSVEAPASKAAGISAGDYIEVFYGGSPHGQENVQAITVKKLPSASLSNYNGEVLSIDFEKKTILCQNLKAEGTTLFRYTDNTQKYLDLNSLKEGDKLNIYYNGMLTKSMPPQGNALEIRKYADTQIYRGTITAISEENGVQTVTLQRAAGTDFETSLQVTVQNSTIMNETLAVGKYAQVLCNHGETPQAYSIEVLLPSESCVYNGVLLEKIYEKSDGKQGTLVVKGMQDGQEMNFLYDSYTKFTEEVENLQPGDLLSIYHTGVVTLSIPPQGNALEISRYKP